MSLVAHASMNDYRLMISRRELSGFFVPRDLN